MTSTLSPAQVQRSTILGGLAVILWSSTVAFSRSLTEQLGTFTSAALIYIIAGLLGLVMIRLQANGWQAVQRLPAKYLIGCGGLFVIYITALYLGIGSSATREQVLAVGLINYLWPALSLVFSIPILGRKAKPLLPVGITLALFGTWLATTGGSNIFSAAQQPDAIPLLPYALALVAAISWALYSNLSRRWAAGHDGAGVPLFLLASGLLLGLLRLFQPETSNWTPGTVLELLYMAVFPGMLAYVLWDNAVRRGKIILVASLSYLTPLLSTVFSSIVLSVDPGAALWFGSILVIAGAVVCKYSIDDDVDPANP